MICHKVNALSDQNIPYVPHAHTERFSCLYRWARASVKQLCGKGAEAGLKKSLYGLLSGCFNIKMQIYIPGY